MSEYTPRKKTILSPTLRFLMMNTGLEAKAFFEKYRFDLPNMCYTTFIGILNGKAHHQTPMVEATLKRFMPIGTLRMVIAGWELAHACLEQGLLPEQAKAYIEDALSIDVKQIYKELGEI